jgi:quercetin dioxygenase-like cupin family protein
VLITGSVSLLLVLLATTTPRQDGPLHLGPGFTLREATPIAELSRHPGTYFNRDVRIEGIIASACMQEGCFIEVVPEDGGGEGVVVNFPDSTRFPVDCAGRRVVVEGMFYQKIYPASRVAHWQGHSFRQGKPVGEFSLIPRLTAKAAELGARQTVPAPGDIVPATTDHVDLATMEFETDGFGTGRKVLQPGGITERHSTGKSRELIFCLEGAIAVRLGSGAPITLKAGEMTYVPAATEHELRNPGPGPATYLFVFSRAPEPQPEVKPHTH